MSGGERNVEGLALIVGNAPAIADRVLLQWGAGRRRARRIGRQFRRQTDRAAAIFQRPLAGERDGFAIRAGGAGGVGAVACKHQLAARAGLVTLGGNGVAIGVGHGIVGISSRGKKCARAGERQYRKSHSEPELRIERRKTFSTSLNYLN